jgi:hypothetical protein
VHPKGEGPPNPTGCSVQAALIPHARDSVTARSRIGTRSGAKRFAGHLESLGADEILSGSSQVENNDTVARRTFGLDSPAAGSGAVNLHVLSGGRAVVQVNQKNE